MAVRVLWYTGLVGPTGVASWNHVAGIASYKTAVSAVAVSAGWALTYWDSGAIPAGTFDVLVVASGSGIWENIAFAEDPINAWPDYTSLAAALPGFSFSPSNNRIVVSGDDADFGLTNRVVTPGSSIFLTNAVNWAGSGSGTGRTGLVLLENEPGVDWATFFSAIPPPSLQVSFGLTGFTNSSPNDASTTLQDILDPTHPVMAGLSNGFQLSRGSGVFYTAVDPALWTSLSNVQGFPAQIYSMASIPPPSPLPPAPPNTNFLTPTPRPLPWGCCSIDSCCIQPDFKGVY